MIEYNVRNPGSAYDPTIKISFGGNGECIIYYRYDNVFKIEDTGSATDIIFEVGDIEYLIKALEKLITIREEE
jgi:hypothetical protein